MSHPTAILVFVKYPITGKVKTRLAATIGDERACEIYQRMVTFVSQKILSQLPPTDFTPIWLADPFQTKLNYSWWLGEFSKFEIQMQEGADLGQRLKTAFQKALTEYSSAIAIGTDCLEISETDFSEARWALDEKDLILGPSHDGGYYLIGMKEPRPFLFESIHWSSPSVMQETLAKATEHQLDIQLLTKLGDIDCWEDLVNFRTTQSSLARAAGIELD